MPEDSNHHDWCKRTEAAAMIGVQLWTLDGWARKGYGPPWYKFGRTKRYDRREVREWIEAQRQEGTS
jgi:DNA-binding transcriptional MerR regulator